jgi:hypothetical protein
LPDRLVGWRAGERIGRIEVDRVHQQLAIGRVPGRTVERVEQRRAGVMAVAGDGHRERAPSSLVVPFVH